jgi:hypothetical protein
MKIKHVEEASWDETMKKNSDLQPKVQKIIMLPLDSTIYDSKVKSRNFKRTNINYFTPITHTNFFRHLAQRRWCSVKGRYKLLYFYLFHCNINHPQFLFVQWTKTRKCLFSMCFFSCFHCDPMQRTIRGKNIVRWFIYDILKNPYLILIQILVIIIIIKL